MVLWVMQRASIKLVGLPWLSFADTFVLQLSSLIIRWVRVISLYFSYLGYDVGYCMIHFLMLISLSWSGTLWYSTFWFDEWIWWVTDHSSSIICRRKKPTRCYTVVYWTCNLLNMFRALLCPSSGAWDYTESISTWHMTPCSRLVTRLLWGCRLCVRDEGCSLTRVDQL
jgi:hypothetical protein